MLTINAINANGEILRKLLNSVADKYDCGVHFNMLGEHLAYEGDQTCAMEIAKETMEQFTSWEP
jgi:hypothetical protein